MLEILPCPETTAKLGMLLWLTLASFKRIKCLPPQSFPFLRSTHWPCELHSNVWQALIVMLGPHHQLERAYVQQGNTVPLAPPFRKRHQKESSWTVLVVYEVCSASLASSLLSRTHLGAIHVQQEHRVQTLARLLRSFALPAPSVSRHWAMALRARSPVSPAQRALGLPGVAHRTSPLASRAQRAECARLELVTSLREPFVQRAIFAAREQRLKSRLMYVAMTVSSVAPPQRPPASIETFAPLGSTVPRPLPMSIVTSSDAQKASIAQRALELGMT